MLTFKPYGPFDVPIEDGLVSKSKTRDFWKKVNDDYPGLKDAVGCYIFATEGYAKPKPWYVGKTEQASFEKEIFQAGKLLHYQTALNKRKKSKARIYLIARVTKAKFARKRKKTNRTNSIGKLEELLIGACLIKNPDLCNKSFTRHLKDIQVPGYMNDGAGAKNQEAKQLARLLK